MPRSHEKTSSAREEFNKIESNNIDELLRLVSKNDIKAFNKLEELAKSKESFYSLVLGDIFLHGRYGVFRDERKGLNYLQNAFDKGSREAGYRLAARMEFEKKYDKAYEIYRDNSNRGHVLSMYRIGLGHINEKWQISSMKEARRYFDMAASTGHLNSKHWVYYIDLRESNNFRNAVKNSIKYIGVSIYIKLKNFLPRIGSHK